MNRKKEMLIYIILIPLFIFTFMRLGGYFFTAKDVFYACEEGLSYGPSEKILAEYEFQDKSRLIVGMWEENLSAISVRPAFGVLWKLKQGGVRGFIPCDKMVTGALFANGKVIGLTGNKEISEVYCRIEYGDYENPMIQEVTMAVDQDGFFNGEWESQSPEDMNGFIAYTEGRNSRDEVIYRDGMTKQGVYYNDGVEEQLIYEE
ncbi:hypothetical protein [Anaerotignum sp. MB30-C6]|uniref:hypothetical protein n=1 Tax=Anaerotignum sp. MB30-C6 TaxID=3070814 RepID=UPI0027DE28D4|nr:hypothetical protein [Anaerotignum sp. MB30-C6]WMI80642.1 hypothetical protein RBQ60_12525 [Anaerotignum sp. MB30-C6]